MDASTKAPTSVPSSNPPSVEVAYKRKCIALKKRLNEIETENELMRVRNKRGWKYVQKMRLESCILLERLSNVTGMAEEAQSGVNPELRARAAAMMSNAAGLNGSSAGGMGAGNDAGYVDDETEGSSEEHPPTPQPQERPLRLKRSRKSAANKDEQGDDEEGHGSGHPSTWRYWPADIPAPTQEEMTSSFRIQTGSNGGSTVDRNSYSRRPSGQDPSRNDTADVQQQQQQSQPAPADNSTTPMDMDSKEPKVES